MPFWAAARQLEREAQHAIHAGSREDALLHDELALGAGENPAADARVLALGVLAHDVEIDVAGHAIRERRWHAFQQAHRPQVDVLIELAPDLEEQAPERDMIRHERRPADRAEKDRVVRADLPIP